MTSAQTQQSEEPTAQSNHQSGSERKERFDPINNPPPGGWRLTSHIVGGNCDIAGTRREKAVWDHPQFGELVVKGQQPEGTFEDKVFSVECDGAEQLDDVDLPQSGINREAAYDAAVEMLNETQRDSSE